MLAMPNRKRGTYDAAQSCRCQHAADDDNLFGDGFHLFCIGTADYEDKAGEYEDAANAVSAYYELDTEAEDFDAETVLAEMKAVNGEEFLSMFCRRFIQRCDRSGAFQLLKCI